MTHHEGSKHRTGAIQPGEHAAKDYVFRLSADRCCDTPEQALAQWNRDRLGIPQKGLEQLTRVQDLVLVVIQPEARSKSGWVEILTIHLRHKSADEMLDELLGDA